MARVCPRCSAAGPEIARFCPQCGQALTADAREAGGGPERPASTERLVCPAGFSPCLNSTGLYYRWEAVEKDSFFGCEYLGITLLNGETALGDVGLRLTGRDNQHRLLFDLERRVHRMDRGQSLTLEVARHELPQIPDVLEITLLGAQRLAEDEPEERRKPCTPWWSSQWD